MRAWILLVAVLWLAIAQQAIAQQGGTSAPNIKALKGRSLPGFTWKKTVPKANGVVELWKRDADAAQLRIEVIPKASLALAEARLKAVNAKISTKEPENEELLFLYQTGGPTKSWTNYRGTHHITFHTYRCWILRNTTLVMADVSLPSGKPNFDEARGAFVAAKRAADSTLKAMGLL